jgi:amino acid adenylation domain-containing protein
MTIIEFVSHLRRLDVKLWLEGERLRYSAPQGVLTDELFKQLAERKAEIIAFLRAAGGVPLPAAPPIIALPREGNKSPLSFAQQRLWLFDQLALHPSVYNIPITYRIRGPLNVKALGQSLNEIIRRHEVLRTIFVSEDGQPVQVVSPGLSLAIADIDLRRHPVAERENSYQQLALREAQQPFDLSTGPLLRANLLRLDEEEYVLLLTTHHIIADGWSIRVFIRELGTLYESYAAGKPSPLPELPIQYADFAAWQREWLSDELLETQLAYWRRQLGGGLPVLELPSDRPRPAVQSFRGARQRLIIPAPVTEALKELSRRSGVTLFMTLLAAFKVLLMRYSAATDIVVGTPIANRTRLETESLIGFFVNTLVLRTDLSGDPSFSELLRRVREMSLAAYEHQEVPFEKVVEALEPDRSLSHTPLFQVMFALQNTPRQEMRLSQLTLTEESFDTEHAKFDLTLVVEETGGGLHANFNYSTDLFDAQSIRRMAGHYGQLLESIVKQAERPISRLPLLSEEERDEVLKRWNQTNREYPRAQCVHELFAEQAAQRPEAVAVEQEGAQLSYRELNERANQLAHHLRGLGVGRESRVGLLMERSLEMVIGIVGILKAGGAYVPLDREYPAQRLRWMVEDSGAEVLVTQGGLGEVVGGVEGLRVVSVDSEKEEIRRQSREQVWSGVSAENLAYVIYTSGSTGVPKGVSVTHRSIVRLVKGTDYAEFGPDEIFLQLAPISFDASTFEIWGSLLNGARLVMMKPGPPTLEALGKALKRHQVTTLWLTAGLFHLMVEERLEDLGGVKQLLAGGDVLPVNSVRKALSALGEGCLINGYGPTENTTFTCCYRMTSGTEIGATVPIGRPVANTKVYVLDEEMRPVAVGLTGELYIEGDGLARGYWRRPDLTAEKFVPHPFSAQAGARLYRTGDLVRHLADGRLEFIGRDDQQVKIRGFRIELGEIETALGSHRAVRDCVVTAHKNASGQKSLVAYVVVRQQPSSITGELRSFLSEKLPDYMVPSTFLVLDALPLTPNGKVDRQALPAPDAMPSPSESQYVVARTPVEQIVAEMWGEVLGLKQVGAEDNFFELGGHSLLATQLISRVGRIFQIEVPLRSLFENPTVAGLARHIERESGGQSPALATLERAPREAPLSLSFAQQRLWFLNQLEPGSAAYNIPVAVRLRGRLRVSALEQSLKEIVRRHEALRTSFSQVNGQPVQVVHETTGMNLSVTDLRGLEERQREVEARRLAGEEARRGFDLAHGPLVRASLLRLAEEDHVLVLTLHHIVSDGWSMGVLIREMAALYEAYSKGRASPLQELPIQYADYAFSQRQWLTGELLDEHLHYWKQQLGGSLPVLELPSDRPRPVVQSRRGASHSFELSASLSAGLRKLSREQGVTLFMTLLGAFQVFLMRLSGEPDVVVGTPVANRTRVETESLIGFFVNTLVLRTDLSGEPSFEEVLRRVREVCLGAYAHQDVPFEKVVEALEPDRSLSHAPLFQVMFALQNTPRQELTLAGLSLTPLTIESKTAKFDLTLAFVDTDEGLRGAVEYNVDLFDATTISRLVENFETLLEGIVAAPARRIGNLPLLPEAQRRRQLREWNDTRVEYPAGRCVHHLFEAQAQRTPDAIALIFEEQQLTYGELNERATLLAQHLRGLGVRPEVLVGLMLDRSVEMLVGLLGILKAGGAYVPLDPAYPPRRLALMLEDARMPVIVTQTTFAETLPARPSKLVCLDTYWETPARESRADMSDEVTPDNLAYVLYTSGSTGKPKGAQIPHSAVVNFLSSMCEQIGLTETGVLLAVTSLSFDIAVLELLLPLIVGARVEIVSRATAADAERIKERIVQSGVTMMQATPITWRMLVDKAGWEISGLEILCGGEALSRELADRLLERGATLWNLYGPTETTIWSTIHKVEKGDGLVPIGRPIANTQVYILDEYLECVPVGVTGELYIGGAGLARGYLSRAVQTAENFIPHRFSDEAGARLYRTGDLARYLPDGKIEFLGRRDDQVKIRGYRIEVGEVEAVLATHAAVRDVVVAAREDETGEKRLVAYVVAKPEHKPSFTELREFVREALPEHMVPSSFKLLDALPLTPNGKIDRRALPAPDTTRQEMEAVYVAPRTTLEEIVAGIWQRVLSVKQVGVEDNFFELGGHSLLATNLISLIHEMLQVEVPLRRLFEGPTVAQLSQAVIDHETKAGQTEKIAHILKRIQEMNAEEVREALR